MAWEEWEQLKAEAAERQRSSADAIAHAQARMQLNQVAPADAGGRSRADAGGGSRPDIDIRTKGVRGTALDTETLSRQAMQRLSHSLDTSDEVYVAHSDNGWLSPVQLQVCALKWEDHMVSLARQLGDLSAKLKDSADGYDSADAEAEARLRAAVQDLRRG